MNPTIFEKQRTLNCKMPIIILSLVSLICTVLSCISYFVYYDFEYIDGDLYHKLAVSFPDFLGLLSLILTLAPSVLMVIYILKFHSQFKATVLVPVLFGMIAVYRLYCIIENIMYRYGFTPISFILDLAIIVSFSMVSIDALKGFPKKPFLIIAITVGLLLELFSIINFCQIIEWFIEDGLYLYLFTRLIYIIGTVSLYVALLLFGLKNRIPAILPISAEKEKKNAEKLSPEQALRLLKDKLDLGMITDEEYQSQRTEIINKL